MGGIRIWNDARTAVARSSTSGQLRMRWAIQIKNETTRELADVSVRLVFEDGGKRTFEGPPVAIRKFSNLNVPHEGSLLPWNKSAMDGSIVFEAPANLWMPSTYAHPELVGASTYRHADLHDAGHLFTKLVNSDRPAVLALLKKDPTLLKVKNDQNMTVTLMSFAACDTEVIKYVLAHGGNPKDVSVRNAGIMHSAAVNGYPGVVDFALKLGAGVDAKTKSGRTPLSKAIIAGQPIGWRALLRLGADPWGRGSEWTPARTAIQEGMKPALDDLVKAGVKPTTIDGTGQGWLHYAVFNYAFMDSVKSYGIPVDQRGAQGQTPLMVAAWAGWEEPQVWLLRHGADPYLKDKRGKTAFDYADTRAGKGRKNEYFRDLVERYAPSRKL